MVAACSYISGAGLEPRSTQDRRLPPATAKFDSFQPRRPRWRFRGARSSPIKVINWPGWPVRFPVGLPGICHTRPLAAALLDPCCVSSSHHITWRPSTLSLPRLAPVCPDHDALAAPIRQRGDREARTGATSALGMFAAYRKPSAMLISPSGASSTTSCLGR